MEIAQQIQLIFEFRMRFRGTIVLPPKHVLCRPIG